MTARQLAPALVLVLALPGELALAQRSHHGGGRSGGSRGGSAVVRGSSPGARYSSPGGRYSSPGMRSGPSRGSHVRPGHATGSYGGGVAQRRHPRAGTGSGGWGYYPSHRGGHYKPYHGSYYRPYYYPYHGGYYRPWFYGSVYLGWPSYSGWPYYSTWPYYTGAYYAGDYYAGDYYTTRDTYPPSDDSSYDAPAPYLYEERGEAAPAPRARDAGRSEVVRGASGQLRLEVRPDDTSVYVDDGFRGTAREARILTLPQGRHTIELVRPGYAIERREVEIVKRERADLLVELRRP